MQTGDFSDVGYADRLDADDRWQCIGGHSALARKQRSRRFEGLGFVTRVTGAPRCSARGYPRPGTARLRRGR